MDCTASLISVLVARFATWNTSVFSFSLIARPFSVITGRRRIWYADFIRPPPPLFHVASGAAENAKLSSAPLLRLPPAYVAVSKSNSSAKSAASRSPAAKRLPGRSAAGDKDAPRCRSPTRLHEDFANSRPDCDFHAWKPRPAALCYRL